MANMMSPTGGLIKKDDGIPILIPEESILEGFIKTRKSLKIESIFFGTLLSTQKVIIDSTSVITGDIICAELIISGVFEGNVFCTGKVECNGRAKITGKVYTKLFQNEDSCDLNCIIQVPNNEVFEKIREFLSNIDASTKLSTDSTLAKIKELFFRNVYSHTKAAVDSLSGTMANQEEAEIIP
jgi:cytoskeletal protein CcmA (bactofilin family)